MRKKLPSKLDKKVLIKNRHCCCICQRDGIGKEVIIHHIDGNNSNNIISNLAVLCLIHASQADAGLSKGKLGSGKKLKPDAVREYKRLWERKIEVERNIQKQILPITQKKQVETLFYFEIRKTITEIIALNDADKRVKEKFKFLDQLYFEEAFSNLNLRKILIQAYSDISVLTIETNNLPKVLCASILNLFLHLVGPEEVPIRSEDKKLFAKSLDVLKTLGEFAAEFNNKSVLKKVCDTIYEFGEIATWYNLKKEKREIYEILNKMKKYALDFEDKKRTKTVINEREERKKIIDKTLNDIKKIA
jgi:hypothetical protein